MASEPVKACRHFTKQNHLLRNQLITKHLPHVKRIVHRIATNLSSYIEIDELINAGNIGLIEAAKRYDISIGSKFMNYA